MVLFMKDKGETTEKMKAYITYIEQRFPTASRSIRVDNGKEYINKELKNWCTSKGIDIEPTAPYSSSQNGVAERFNRTLMELA
jgi:transposase InsO family protein